MAKDEKIKDESKEVGYIKPREIVAEMQESYLDYAMSVIVSRALPDVRDGLKPVHRRILFVMYEDGLRHNVKFRKSANVVGLCLARYHPHGDMAVYDSMVRMAQDFSLRYPLIKGQGNWGSVDGDSAAAQRYCITGDSLVITDRCLEKISTVSDKEDVSIKVLSFKGRVNHASKLFDSGVHPVTSIRTLHGYSLRGTSNHPILVLEKSPAEGRPIFKWKLLHNIQDGDFAVIDRNHELLWPVREPSLKRFFPRVVGNRTDIYALPHKMSNDLAFLLGLILSEGFISTNLKKRYSKIGFCNTDKKLVEKFIFIFEELFHGCPIYKAVRGPLGYGKQNFISLEVCSSYIEKFLKAMGLKEVPAREKEIPEIIFHATKKSVGAFLQGVFEGDGSISRKGSNPEIRLCSASEKLLEQIQVLLLRFGIDSFLRKDKRKDVPIEKQCWHLDIRGYDNFKFFENIGFFSTRKQEQLKRSIKVNYNACFNGKVMSKTDLIPFLSDYLRIKYRYKIQWDEWEYLAKHNLDRYIKLQKVFPRLMENLEKDDVEMLDFFITQHYLFDKIISKEKAGEERVYSFRVDSDCHSFISNGFISHNTECKLSPMGEEMLADIEKDTVNFIANYDSTRTEPAVLPSPLPQLLLNGSFGIAVGMATSIPTHNTGEVLQSTIHLLENPQATTEDLFQFFQGPDFPTGGIIYGKKDIIAAYSQGKGPILTRGKAEIEETKKGNSIIVVTEIPFQVQKSALVMQMAKLVEDKRVEGIKDIRDESGRDGMRIVIELKKEAFPKKVLNALFKYTDLQKTFHLNMIALVDGIQPRVLGLVDVLSFYLKHKEEVVVRRTKYDLQKAKDRAHILEGLMLALKNIDEVIKVIKQSASRDDAKINLQKRFKFTDIQAIAILEMRLAQLAKLERDKIEKELAEIEQLIKELNLILSNPKKLKELIKSELQAMAEKYKDNRRTKVMVGRLGEIGDEDLIPQEEAIITITQGGFIKRMKSSAYHTQKRGGKGVAGMEVNEEDIVEHFVVANTLDKMMFFTDSGKIFQCFAWEIPELTRISKGRGLLNFIEITPQDKVLSLISYTKKDEDLVDKFLVMVTKDGIIKKTILSAFKNVRKNGLLAVKLQPGDSLRSAKIADKDDEISLITKNGQSIRFKESDVRPMGRGASGVKGMKIGKAPASAKAMAGEDEVIAMDVIKLKIKNEKLLNSKGITESEANGSWQIGEGKGYLLVITENGYGKRTDVEEYRLQHRGGSGIKAAKINEKTGKIVFAKILEPNDEDLIVISKKGQVIRSALKAISIHGRAASGVRVMRLASGDKVASGTCLSTVLVAEEPTEMKNEK